jgi:hypothetical protein
VAVALAREEGVDAATVNVFGARPRAWGRRAHARAPDTAAAFACTAMENTK